jgi:hypothetical protein
MRQAFYFMLGYVFFGAALFFTLDNALEENTRQHCAHGIELACKDLS